jgi:fatty acid desaturase
MEKFLMSYYLSARQKRFVTKLHKSGVARGEWPTWLLICIVYSSWLLLVLQYERLGALVTLPLLALVSGLYMSLQHELIHGHPTRWPMINALIGTPPLAIWFPFALYRDSHLKHHEEDSLTVPGVDPESRYVTHQQWQEAGVLRRLMLRAEKTLLVRLILGPLRVIVELAMRKVPRLLRGEAEAWKRWGPHLALCGFLLGALQYYCGIPAWLYLLAVAYPALSLSMLRSFHEHRPAVEPAQRCVINEASWPLRLLFLNNNLHLVHHDLPGLPWYLLPRVYRANRRAYRRRSGDFVFDGYVPLLQRYGVTPIDEPQHPFVVGGRHE